MVEVSMLDEPHCISHYLINSIQNTIFIYIDGVVREGTCK